MNVEQQIVEDIANAVRSRGKLTQNEIMYGWDLSSAQFNSIKSLVNKFDDIESGPRSIGGFTVKQSRSRLPEVGNDNELKFFMEPWKSEAVARLVNLLTHQELENLIGHLAYTLRQTRKQESGQDRRGTKNELATALILKHDEDIFSHRGIREVVARHCKVKSPRRWIAGKQTAINFVQSVGFPDQFAGVERDASLPDYEYLEGRMELPNLADFQVEVQEKLLRSLHTPGERAIVSLPTGAGKTRVAVQTLRDWMSEFLGKDELQNRSTVLWLAHTEELCEQAYRCFKDVWTASSRVCPVTLFRFWGGYTRDFGKHVGVLGRVAKEPAILVSTPQRIRKILDDDDKGNELILEAILQTSGAIIIDEAHRAAAPTYRHIIQCFGGSPQTCIVGLTATPFREEYADENLQGTKELKDIFKRIIEPAQTLGKNPKTILQSRRYLSKPIRKQITTSTILHSLKPEDPGFLTEEDISRIDNRLKLDADRVPRRMKILSEIVPIFNDPDSHVLYFGPSVLDAESMAFMLRNKGILAATVSGETRTGTRRRIIEDFKSRRLQVLCSCEVLTTGFDAPTVTHVIMARPTVSRVLYEQMLGRGLRGPRFGGTEECIVFDCKDDYRDAGPPPVSEDLWKVWSSEIQNE